MNCNSNNREKNDMSKEQLKALISEAVAGDQAAFDALNDLYNPLIESQTRNHSQPEMTNQDIEDMRQEALIAFCNAVCSYDVEQEDVEFGLYAKICISNALIAFVRIYMRRVKKDRLALESEKQNGSTSRQYDPLQAMVDKENMSELVRVIRNKLSDYENRVWWLYVSGMSVSDISKELGDTEPKSVTNAIYRIRKKLRELINYKK